MLTEKDKEAIVKYFGVPVEDLDMEQLRKIHRELRAKFHPDNFEKFEDETVREMATERFQLIENLATQIEQHLSGKTLGFATKSQSDAPFMQGGALFAIRKLKIELITSDKDLKYHLFGTFYRWLQYGDTFKIPDTKASIVMDEDHQGNRIGFQETIRMYLTFDEQDSIEAIVAWLFPKIQGRASRLLIAGDRVEIDPFELLYAIRKASFLRIEAPQAQA